MRKKVSEMRSKKKEKTDSEYRVVDLTQNKTA